MKRIFLILFCINLFAQHTKLPMNISEVISLENPTYTVPSGHILQTLPLGTEEDPFDGSTQPGTVGVNDGVSGGWWSLEKIILTEGHKISSSLSAGALLYDLGSLKANVKAFKVLWYDESYTIPENTVAEIYSVYSTGINGNPDESTFRKANETEDKALIEGMVLSEGTSIKSWGVISIIEYDENYSNNEIGVLSFVTEAGNVGVRLSSANAANHGDIGNTAVDLSYQSSASTTTGATGQSSFAVGLDSTASGAHSISGGYASVASGDTSVALGNGAKASGTFSYSIGQSSDANGDNSVALGFFNESDGQYATSMGKSTKASGISSTSIGDSTTASGQTATAMGENTTASGYVSLALGKNTTSSAEQSIAAGYGSIAEGNRSTALGLYSKASGTSSTALGLHTVSESPSSLVIGTWNELNEGDEWPLFVIGNGGWDASATNYLGGEENRSNAFEVLFDGTTTIAGDLSINSDARLKANIVSLGATLSKLLQIDGKSYTMKKDKREKQKIGLLAQDIEKVFPELVSESNGIKSVNYQGLVPVLINALKEQDVFMKEQQRILSVQQSELDELKSMMKKIIER